MFTHVHTYDCANAVVTQSFSTGHPWRARPLLVLPFSPPQRGSADAAGPPGWWASGLSRSRQSYAKNIWFPSRVAQTLCPWQHGPAHLHQKYSF